MHVLTLCSDLKKGECFEWGLAMRLPQYNVNIVDSVFTWSTTDRFSAASLSGPAMFYNTLGDASNVRCVPYHVEDRYEMYALEDIKAGTELTIRYDSINWRNAMKEVKSIVGTLESGHKE